MYNMTPTEQLSLIPTLTKKPDGTTSLRPEELDWLEMFDRNMASHAKDRAWTAALHDLAQMGIWPVGHCICALDGAWATSTWLHAHHGLYNAQVRHSILRHHARAPMLKELYDFLRAPVDTRGFGALALREHELMLKDFLQLKPRHTEWFRGM